MLYEVRVAANKGLGLFAKHTIPRGTRILAEKPLIALRRGQRPSEILSCAERLDGKRRETLLGLSWHPGGGIKRLGRWGEAVGWAVRDRRLATFGPGRMSDVIKTLDEAFQILSIFRSNSFNLASSANVAFAGDSSPSSPSTALPTSDSNVAVLDLHSELDVTPTAPSSSPPYELALFPAIARINHSCVPNAQANYHPLHRTFNVHATRDMAAGEEVSINYLPEVGLLRAQRVAKLEEGYGFTCNCPACDLSTELGRQGEKSRRDVQTSMRKTRAYLADATHRGDAVDAGYGADGMPETFQSGITDEEQARIDALGRLSEAERRTLRLDGELQVLKLMLAMYSNEGIVGREVASMHYHMARLQSSSSALEDGLASAEAGLKLEEECLGRDHPGYLEASAFVEGLRERIGSVREVVTQGVASA